MVDVTATFDDVEQEFCNWASTLTFGDIPHAAVDKVRELIADTVGCVVGGLHAPTAVQARALSTPSELGGVSVIGLPDKWAVAEAARHMSIASHVLEMDDIVPSGSVHPGAVVIPAAIAAGELLNATGKQLITAIAVGYELTARLGEAVDPATHYNDGFHPTATCGVFGAAAAVASLLGASAHRYRTALGAASTAVAGTLAYLNDGAYTKPIQVGNAAASGTFAALLDHAGVTGSATVFGGRYGFFHAYAPKADSSILSHDLGIGRMRVEESGIKPFACCRYIQPGIGLLIESCIEHDLSADQISEIRFGVVGPATEIVGEPRQRKVNPSTSVDVQFSLPYSAAIAVFRRQLMPIDVQECLGDPRLIDFAQRVHLVHDPGLDERYPSKWGGWIEIERPNGPTIRLDTVEPKGDPANPLTAAELHRKLVALAGAEVGGAIEAATNRLEQSSVREFIATIEESS
jgi:2-methylcitrate dehydratase PrpD